MSSKELVVYSNSSLRANNYNKLTNFQGKSTSIANFRKDQAFKLCRFIFGEFMNGLAIDEEQRAWIILLMQKNEDDIDVQKIESPVPGITLIDWFTGFWNTRKDFPWQIKIIKNFI